MEILSLQFHIKEMDYMILKLYKIHSLAASNYQKSKQAKACKYMINQILFKDEILQKKFNIQNIHNKQKKNY